MAPESLQDLFLAAAGVAGALIGLLFVAFSVEHDRITGTDADQVARIRARSALTAFTNALAVSMWALTPGNGLSAASISVGVIGVLFVIASLLSVRRTAHDRGSHPGRVRDLTFLITQFVVFALQIFWGVQLARHHHDASAADNIATLVIVCFLIGIYRAWELIGGPEIGLGHELRWLLKHRDGDEAPSDSPPASDTQPAPRGGD